MTIRPNPISRAEASPAAARVQSLEAGLRSELFGNAMLKLRFLREVAQHEATKARLRSTVLELNAAQGDLERRPEPPACSCSDDESQRGDGHRVDGEPCPLHMDLAYEQAWAWRDQAVKERDEARRQLARAVEDLGAARASADSFKAKALEVAGERDSLAKDLAALRAGGRLPDCVEAQGAFPPGSLPPEPLRLPPPPRHMVQGGEAT